MSHPKSCQIGKIGSIYEFLQDEICIKQAKHSIVFRSGDLSRCSKYIVRLCNDHFYRFYNDDELRVNNGSFIPNDKRIIRFTFRKNRL